MLNQQFQMTRKIGAVFVFSPGLMKLRLRQVMGLWHWNIGESLCPAEYRKAALGGVRDSGSSAKALHGVP
jgi:hypothetical protein